MSRDRSEIGELIATIFDRLDEQFEGRAVVLDAVLLVEVSDPEDRLEYDDHTGRDAPATIVMLESTTDRLTIQTGIIKFADRILDGDQEE